MNKPLIIAHRGASREAPENTMAAFRLAWQQGADAIETDLRLTADGRIVAIHDSNGRRTLADARNIASMTLAELRSLDAGRWKHGRWAGEQVPTLEDILAALPDEKTLVLELKENLASALADILPCTMLDRITLISFDAETIRDAKRRLPACRALWLFKDYATISKMRRGSFLAARVRDLGIDGVDLRYGRNLTHDLLEPLRENHLTILTYTVNSAAGARRCGELGLDGITTDKPGKARQWLRISA